jgi:hypothetical protein
MAKATTKTEAKSEVRERRVFLTLTGRSASYSTPRAFIEEALRLGVSRKVVGASVHPGDVVLFTVAPHNRLKREVGFTFQPLVFGYSVVKGYAIHARTEIARKVLAATINELLGKGLAEVAELNEVVTRRCGYYCITRKITVHDWDAFLKTFHDLWSKELRIHPDVAKHKTLSHYDFLIQGNFKAIDPYLELPFPVKYTRTLRLIKPDELALLQETLKERLDVAAVDAIFDERPDQPAILLELNEYVQQAIGQPKANKAHRRRKKTKQPTHIPEPEPIPEPVAPKPLIDLQPEQKPQPHCIHCGRPTEGAILCPECRERVLNKIKELKGVNV